MIEAVDLRRLHVLRMVDAHGTVTAAAGALHLTPSAVSHQLRQLAREVGVDLLERHGRGVRLTAAGHRLVTHADHLHVAWERARADLEALQDGTVGTLRLCGFPTAAAAVLAPVAARLAVDLPGLDVHVLELGDTSEAVDLLLADRADIAIVELATTAPPLDDIRLEQEPLLAEPLDLVVSSDHPLSSADKVGLDMVAREPWILAGPASWDCHQIIVAACSAAGFAPHVVHEARTPATVAALVTHGLGVTLMPRLAPLGNHGLVRIGLTGDPPPQRRLATCVRRGSATRPAVTRGLSMIREVSNDLPAPLPRAPNGPLHGPPEPAHDRQSRSLKP